jgi:hypothetical protein
MFSRLEVLFITIFHSLRECPASAYVDYERSIDVVCHENLVLAGKIEATLREPNQPCSLSDLGEIYYGDGKSVYFSDHFR